MSTCAWPRRSLIRLSTCSSCALCVWPSKELSEKLFGPTNHSRRPVTATLTLLPNSYCRPALDAPDTAHKLLGRNQRRYGLDLWITANSPAASGLRAQQSEALDRRRTHAERPCTERNRRSCTSPLAKSCRSAGIRDRSSVGISKLNTLSHQDHEATNPLNPRDAHHRDSRPDERRIGFIVGLQQRGHFRL